MGNTVSLSVIAVFLAECCSRAAGGAAVSVSGAASDERMQRAMAVMAGWVIR
jgi:hypothetical protein